MNGCSIAPYRVVATLARVVLFEENEP